jgi:site-specific recombinase XerD
MSTIKISQEVACLLSNYELFMINNEYSKTTIGGYKTYLSRFLRRKEKNDPGSLSKNINLFLESEKQNHPKTLYECRASLYLYHQMATGNEFPSKQSNISINKAIEKILSGFLDYSLKIKRITDESAKAEINHVRRFLLSHYNDRHNLNFTELSAYDVRLFIIGELNTLKPSSKGRMITSIRNFFNYLKFEGVQVHPSILKIPLSPAVWKKSAFPTTIEEDTLKKLVDISDINTYTGKRDLAIILCFTELALRCLEVASITLDDFDWYSGELSIKHTKTKAERRLPVSKRLGEAIIIYLKEARPKTQNRTLFVRFKHESGTPMGREQIRGVIRRTYAKAGVDSKITGTHILRRTVASRIYNAGNTLKLTADILGHESVDSTMVYAKADIKSLSTVAMPWPEVM